MCPSAVKFKEHKERCSKSPNTRRFHTDEYATNIDIPVLDDSVAPLEVKQHINMLKPDKAGGPDGVSPGVLKMLPSAWIRFLLIFFFYNFYQYL